MKLLSSIWLVQITLGFNLLSTYSVFAQQIVPDGTLPENSIVTPSGNILQIDGGTKAGSNLFHSFQNFTVLTNRTAFFNNAVEIQNIFSRVTGSSGSTIDGIIKANGTANLFLINPNGIIFGPNASLNIGGSFIASTANRIIFSDGFEFSATNPQATPLLTINVPIGLGFGTTPGQIVNESRAEVRNPLIGRTPEQDPTIAGLQVKDGKTLALVGGDVLLKGGNLTANGGRIELGSVAGNNTVSLTPIEKGWQLGYEGVQSFQDISFLTGTIVDTSGNIERTSTIVDTSGNSGGEIQLQGRQITITGTQEGTPVLAFSNTVGDGRGGDIVVKASDVIEISGKISEEFEVIYSASGFRTQTDGAGSAGNIRVETKNLTLSEGGQISSSAGSIFVFFADEPVLTGNAGDISLKTQQLNVLNGGLISTNTYTNGQGGQLSIDASESAVVGGQGKLSVEAIAGSSGRAGDLNITTRQLTVENTGKITSETIGAGDAGDINLNVDKLRLEEARIQADTFLSGKGGVININATESVEISKQSFLSSRTEGSGEGGDLIINTAHLDVQSEAVVTVTTSGRGKAGSLSINTSNLNLTDRGQINARTEGRGEAGNINVTASNVFIEKGARISVETVNRGDAGNITLNVGRLLVQNGGEISSGSLISGSLIIDDGNTSLERGAGGTITINATDSIEVTEASRIATLSQGTGDAGSIAINTNNLNVTDGAEINARTENIGKAGQIDLTASNLRVGKDARISVKTIGAGDAGNIILNTEKFILSDGGQILADTTNTGNGGSITIKEAESVEMVGGLLSTQTQGTGNAGDITINTNGQLTVGEGAVISANTFGRGNAGQINLNVGQLIVQNGGEISSSSLLGENTFSIERGAGGKITINATNSIEVTDTSSIFTLSEGTGNAGDITLNTNNLNVTDGAQINASTENIGKAGQIEVTASNLTVGKDARISVETIGAGNAGNITLNAEKFILSDGGQILADTTNTGNGGSITIKATDLITVSGGSLFTQTEGTGDAGNIFVHTNNLNVTDGAQIVASTRGDGQAGSINVTASTFSISNGGQLLTTTSGIQDAGNINIQATQINFTGDGSGLFANTGVGSEGQGGSIFVNSQTTNLQDGATISVNSLGTGTGGNIVLQGSFLALNDRASLSATTTSTDGGNITLNLNDRLLLRNQSHISATAAQFGNGGNITIDSPFILTVPQENSDITANATDGSGGNINITTQGIFGIQGRDKQTPLSDITASSEFGIQGTINIINPNADVTSRFVEFPENPVDVASLVAENVCQTQVGGVSSFVVSGRGGLPPNPSDPLNQNGTVDWATRSPQENKKPVILKERSQHEQPVIQQVQGWKVEADGTVVLVADASAVTPLSPILAHPSCQ